VESVLSCVKCVRNHSEYAVILKDIYTHTVGSFCFHVMFVRNYLQDWIS